MTTNNLDNFGLYLWRNPEGFHVTLTINYRLPTERRCFFSLGEQTHRSWHAFNQYQPESLRDFFAQFKKEYRDIKKFPNNYWISKLVMNTGLSGRAVGAGAIIVVETDSNYEFILRLKDQSFEGIFETKSLSQKQKQSVKGECLGQYIYRRPTTELEVVDIF